MNKLLLWVPRFWPAVGGTEFHSHRLASELSRLPEAGVEVIIITHSQRENDSLIRDTVTGDSTVIESPGMHIRCLQLGYAQAAFEQHLLDHYDDSRLVRLWYRRQILRRLEERAHDVARDVDLIHFIYNGMTESAELACRLAKRLGIPFVLTPNVLDTSDARHAWNSPRFRRLYREADRLIALTRHEADWLLQQGVPPARIDVIPYGPILEADADGRRFRGQTGIESAPMILFLARLTEIKGYDLLLAARERVWREHPDCHLVFMGPATPASRAAIGACHDRRLHLLETATQQMKTDALAACNFLCLPSRRESLGGVIIEANALGKPAVTLDLGVLRDLVRNDETGLRVDRQGASLAEALCRLLDDPDGCRRLGDAAREQVNRRYTWPAVMSAMRESYRQAARHQ